MTAPNAADLRPQLAASVADLGQPTPLQLAVGALDDATLGYLLGAAVRYQLPRLTYGSGIVAPAVAAVAHALSAGDRAVIARDVAEEFARHARDPDGAVGRQSWATCDAPEWRRLAAALDRAIASSPPVPPASPAAGSGPSA